MSRPCLFCRCPITRAEGGPVTYRGRRVHLLCAAIDAAQRAFGGFASAHERRSAVTALHRAAYWAEGRNCSQRPPAAPSPSSLPETGDER